MRIIRRFLESMCVLVPTLLAFVAAAELAPHSRLEILALRHQLSVLQRSLKKPKSTATDRLLWSWLCAVWRGWKSALVIVKPETVIAWHRRGFRLFWTWKSRHRQPGRPAVPGQVRELIRRTSRENPTWGAPRIHGERLKLGIDIGETSVSKYLVGSPKAALANLADLPGQPFEQLGLG